MRPISQEKTIGLISRRRCLPAAFFILALSGLLSGGQTNTATATNSAPQIFRVNPSEIGAGGKVTLTIIGSGFAKGSYVSFSNPAIHVLSSRWQSDTELDAAIQSGEKAEPGVATLYVSNPNGTSGQIAFTIVVKGSGNNEVQSGQADSPVVTKVEPPHVAAGQQVKIKVKGKNFTKGAKVSFSNPGIEALETVVAKSTELTATLKADPSAAPGPCGLFVVNPDESEVEAGFTVIAASTGASSTGQPTTASSAAAPTQKFAVINLGDAISVLRNSGETHGALIVSGKHLDYEENGKKVFSVNSSQIKEIAPNVFFGISTSTFHIILNSGKTYNFIAASFSPEETQTIVESLRRAFH